MFRPTCLDCLFKLKCVGCAGYSFIVLQFSENFICFYICFLIRSKTDPVCESSLGLLAPQSEPQYDILISNLIYILLMPTCFFHSGQRFWVIILWLCVLSHLQTLTGFYQYD